MNEHGQTIKSGVIFGYLCQGLGGMAHNHLVYRFGKSTKTVLPDHLRETDRTRVAIERLGTSFGGLNRPDVVVMWEDVSDVHKAWEITRDYMRNTLYVATNTRRPEIQQEYPLGDNFFSLKCTCTCTNFTEHLKEAFEILFRTVRE